VQQPPAPPIRKVAVVLISWNGRRHLEVCLAALREQVDPGVDWEVVILDNGSSDGTAKWLRSEHPEVRVIASPVNVGFSAACNRAIAHCDADAVALLNNDTRPRPEWLAALVAAAREAPADVAAVSGLIVDWKGECLNFASGILTFDGHSFQVGYGRPLPAVRLPEPGSELLFACGGNMLIRREAFLAAGGFDEDYFAYFEDVDLGWRLWSRGERVLFTPDAVVHHHSMATSDLLGMHHRGLLFERNAFLTAYKNFEAGWWERWMPAVLLTLSHRIHTLMVENNPDGDQLQVDPYAGSIADTAPREPVSAPCRTPDGEAAGMLPPYAVRAKWKAYGPRQFFRRAASKAWRSALGASPPESPAPTLSDPRTVAHLRAQSFLFAHLDRAAEKRRVVQEARRRSDREIFERFPLHLVPTYPGDEKLFSSPGFQAWLPAEPPLVRLRLDEVMDLP
jgi:GT2 family glycosyltransferase